MITKIKRLISQVFFKGPRNHKIHKVINKDSMYNIAKEMVNERNRKFKEIEVLQRTVDYKLDNKIALSEKEQKTTGILQLEKLN
ncbi:hypothetical protein [Maribacter sp.]|uniref:hypothetical protein n=1 Tax=Maribacter sp. TaxID=1897614 RepID=UPI0025BA453B|nr:hypothetical protein [Maribacter sp.]